MAGRALPVVLELRVEDGTLHGTARVGEGAPREFWGWLGLIALLDPLLEPVEDDESAP